jgi:hypothetical protein
VVSELRLGVIAIGLALFASGCGGGGLRMFPLADPIWVDADQRPFRDKPEEYFSPFAWDGADQTIFRPISRFFAVDPAGEAVNVNALDEVPDSSWFSNRIGRYAITPEQAAQGPCKTPLPGTDKSWTVTGAKPNGDNPGFLIKVDGQKYLVKFDGNIQGPRASAADVAGSRIYHAAGYFVPCNRVIHFDRKILRIAPDAEAENASGDEVPMRESHLDTVFGKAIRLTDGRYRASLSLFIEGTPIGPWTYQGRRKDDPNDVIDHEDRRELRGMRVLAAWINHFDSREQNTLAAWIEVGKKLGFVQHNVIDFGDSFGSVWEPPLLGRRIGHAYYLDFPDILEDFASFGAIERPWDKARFGRSGKVFGYFDVERFEPDEWVPGYPNPAFGRMSERDGAWMARIIAQFSDEHVRTIVATAQMSELLAAELSRILIGRRDKISRRYLTRLSPLADPHIKLAGQKPQLCLEDLGLTSGIAKPDSRRYGARAWLTEALRPAPIGRAYLHSGRIVCHDLPAAAGASRKQPAYVIVDVVAGSAAQAATKPARVHLYHLGGTDYRVVGLERPSDFEPPGS